MKDLLRLGYEFLGEPSLSDVIGIIVFAKRLENRLDQNDLAKMADVEPRIIHRIEGGSSVEIKDLEKVLKSLNLSKKELGKLIVSYMENYEEIISLLSIERGDLDEIKNL